MSFFCWSFLLIFSINIFLSMISCLSNFFPFPILYKSTELKLGFRSVTLFKFNFFSFASKSFSDVYLFRFSWIYVNNICKPTWIIPPARNLTRAEQLELQNLHDYPILLVHVHLLIITWPHTHVEWPSLNPLQNSFPKLCPPSAVWQCRSSHPSVPSSLSAVLPSEWSFHRDECSYWIQFRILE